MLQCDWSNDEYFHSYFNMCSTLFPDTPIPTAGFLGQNDSMRCQFSALPPVVELGGCAAGVSANARRKATTKVQAKAGCQSCQRQKRSSVDDGHVEYTKAKAEEIFFQYHELIGQS